MGLISGTWRGGNLLANDGGPGPKKPPNPNRGGRGLGRGGRGSGKYSEKLYYIYADFTANDQSFSNGQVLDSIPEGVSAGSLNVIETGGTVEIVSNAAVFDEGSADTCGIIDNTGYTKTGGLSLLAKFKEVNVTNSYGPYLGWSAVSGDIGTSGWEYVLRSGTTDGWLNLEAWSGGSRGDYPLIHTLADDTYIETAMVLGGYDSSAEPDENGTYGMFYFRKNAAGDWVPVYSYWQQNTATLYPFFANVDTLSQTTSTLDYMVLPKEAITSPLIPSVTGSSGTTTSDLYSECVITTLPTTYGRIFFRTEDGDNKWYVYMENTGKLALTEATGGTHTERLSFAGVLSNGHRVAVSAFGTTITLFSNDVYRGKYTSSSHLNSTGWSYTLGGGTFAYFTAWNSTSAYDQHIPGA